MRIIRDYKKLRFKDDITTQFSYVEKVEKTGFLPRNIVIKRMFVQGELNKLMSEYENSQLLNDDVKPFEVPISILNIKGLDRQDVINAVRTRANDFYHQQAEQFSDYQKRELELQEALDFYRLHKKEQVNTSSEVKEKEIKK